MDPVAWLLADSLHVQGLSPSSPTSLTIMLFARSSNGSSFRPHDLSTDTAVPLLIMFGFMVSMVLLSAFKFWVAVGDSFHFGPLAGQQELSLSGSVTLQCFGHTYLDSSYEA